LGDKIYEKYGLGSIDFGAEIHLKNEVCRRPEGGLPKARIKDEAINSR
jgi:hypothetical protein